MLEARLFSSIRLECLISSERRSDFEIRYPSLDTSVPAHPLRVGEASLKLFGLQDSWLQCNGNLLPPFGGQVFTITEAVIHSSTGIVCLSSSQFIEDTLDHTDPEADKYQRNHSHVVCGQNGELRQEGGAISLQSQTTKLSGRFLSLLLGNYENHYHWLIMSLSRIALLNKDDLNSLSGILIPADLSSSQRESLRMAKLASYAPLRPVHRGETLQLEELVLPWNAASGYGVNPIAAAYIRCLIKPHPGTSLSKKHRLYIDRRNSCSRRLINENEIVEILQCEGIEPVRMEALSLEAQASLLQNTELIVGPHGAGLTNMVFSKPGTRVVEIMPSGNINWCYRHLAAACRHEYDCVIGRSHPQDGSSPIWAPWVASPTHVLSAVRCASLHY